MRGGLPCRKNSSPPRDELLDREIFYTLTEAQILIERWRRQYNTVRPHSALGYRRPAPDAVMPTVVGTEIDDLEGTCGLRLLPLTAGVLQNIDGSLAWPPVGARLP